MSNRTLKRTLRLFYALHEAFHGTAKILEQSIRDLEGARYARKVEKQRARFPWPDLDKMTLDSRRELAGVMRAHGHHAAAKALAPGEGIATMGFVAEPHFVHAGCPIHGAPSPYDPERQARLQAAIAAARQAMQGPVNKDRFQEIIDKAQEAIDQAREARKAIDAARQAMQGAVPQPAAAPPDPSVIVSRTKLKAVDLELLDRVASIRHQIRGRDVMIFPVHTLIIHGISEADIEQLRACAPDAPPASPPPAVAPPPAEPSEPSPEPNLVVSFRMLQKLDPDLLDRILPIPHGNRLGFPDHLIFSLQTLKSHGCDQGHIDQLVKCKAFTPTLRLIDLELGEVGRDALGLAGVVEGVVNEAQKVAAARRRGVAHEGPPLLGYFRREHVAVAPVGAQRVGHARRGVVGQDQLDVDGALGGAVEGQVTRLGSRCFRQAAPPPIARGQGAGRQGEPSALACKDDQARAVDAPITRAAAPAPLVERAHLGQRRVEQGASSWGEAINARGG